MLRLLMIYFLLFSSLAIELQKKDIRSEETCTKINECMAKVDLNDNEKAILHMGYFPIMALYHYKLNNYEKINSILSSSHSK